MNPNSKKRVFFNNKKRCTITLKDTHSERIEKIKISNYDILETLNKTNNAMAVNLRRGAARNERAL